MAVEPIENEILIVDNPEENKLLVPWVVAAFAVFLRTSPPNT